MEYKATHDALTGLPNRTLLQRNLSEALIRAQRRHRIVAVFFLDLDNFKKVNDSLGHDLGDHLLQEVSKRLISCLREDDTVSRQGGDEFVLVLADVAQSDDVTKLAQKVLHEMALPFEIRGYELFVTTSIGITLFPNDGDESATLLKNADAAMYRAKEQGKNNFEYYSKSMNTRIFKRLAMETDLHRALEKEEFRLHYQPQVSIKTGKIVGMEALIRWQKEGSQMISPADFIPLAEETGLIVGIGEWALQTAAKQNKSWQQIGLPPIRMAVNLSARQFQQKNLGQMVGSALTLASLDPAYLELELTESVLMVNEERNIQTLRSLSESGIRISIDDFGTGYSSLSYLQRFPIHSLKIDRSFIQDIPYDPNNSAIVTAIITLGHTLKLKIIAEGVEKPWQMEYLDNAGCDEIQGYLFSKPLSAEEATRFLTDKQSASLISELKARKV